MPMHQNRLAIIRWRVKGKTAPTNLIHVARDLSVRLFPEIPDWRVERIDAVRVILDRVIAESLQFRPQPILRTNKQHHLIDRSVSFRYHVDGFDPGLRCGELFIDSVFCDVRQIRDRYPFARHAKHPIVSKPKRAGQVFRRAGDRFDRLVGGDNTDPPRSTLHGYSPP